MLPQHRPAWRLAAHHTWLHVHVMRSTGPGQFRWHRASASPIGGLGHPPGRSRFRRSSSGPRHHCRLCRGRRPNRSGLVRKFCQKLLLVFWIKLSSTGHYHAAIFCLWLLFPLLPVRSIRLTQIAQVTQKRAITSCQHRHLTAGAIAGANACGGNFTDLPGVKT